MKLTSYWEVERQTSTECVNASYATVHEAVAVRVRAMEEG
jgi:hypothetical protein